VRDRGFGTLHDGAFMATRELDIHSALRRDEYRVVAADRAGRLKGVKPLISPMEPSFGTLQAR